VSALDDLDEVIEQCQRALDKFVKGTPQPMQMMFSHREDVSLANPFCPPARGWDEVARTMDHAASNLRDGAMVAFEEVAKYVTPELAYTVWLERQEAKLGGRMDITPFTLRVTMVYRPENGTWKVVHRHADPITTAQPAESVIQEWIHREPASPNYTGGSNFSCKASAHNQLCLHGTLEPDASKHALLYFRRRF